ncbi:efflux RND transporter periplasmic adaptor subunit [Novosphingobium sp.]|uniref:efflux RND transporter periplasmic adaptor subunit n=1 Tax=Novosphingobium sp. TaxID=1874826 RepID=UPI0038BD1DF5
MRRSIAIGAALGAGLVMLGLGLRGGGQNAAAAPQAVAPATPVRIFVVGAGADGTGPAAGASYAALIHREREATLSFRLGGRMISSPPREGQRLGAGALVAAIDATPWRAALARAEADAARSARAAQRYGALAPDGAVSQAQARDAADALSAARAGVTAARYDLSSTRLTMPFAGVVLNRRAELGETLAAGQPVASVADLSSPLLATVQVPVARIAGLQRGTGAQVLVPGRAQPIAARVMRIGAASDARSGTVAVDLALEGAGGLPSGTSASAVFAGGAGSATASDVTVPAEALLEAGGARATLYVIDSKGRARRTQVGFLGFSDRMARVSGLAPGARVITAGAGFVGDGEAVVVTAE